MVALFEKFPGHGQYAAPLVRDVMKAYFDKKARLAALQQQKQGLTAGLNRLNLGVPDGSLPVERQVERQVAAPIAARAGQ